MTANSIKVTDLVFEYPTRRVLHGLNFSISTGSVTALVGPNGAGKTTLLRCLAALSHPFSGEVEICGINTEIDPRKIHSNVAYLADFFGLYSDLTVYRSLHHMASVHGIIEDRVEAVVQETLEELGLESLKFQLAGKLSRGQRQRLAIGMAIIHKPPVLMLDEPASGLDPEARHSLSELILKLKKRDMTIIVSSHILSELEDYSDAMLTISEGRVLGHQGIKDKEQADTSRIIEFSLVSNNESVQQMLKELDVTSSVEQQANTYSFAFSGDRNAQAVLLKSLIERGLGISSFKEKETSMQDVYMSQIKSKATKG